jgi:hypothetical protein
MVLVNQDKDISGRYLLTPCSIHTQAVVSQVEIAGPPILVSWCWQALDKGTFIDGQGTTYPAPQA